MDVISSLDENHQTYEKHEQDYEYKETSDKLLHNQLSSDSSFDRSISNNEQEISETNDLTLHSKLAVKGCSIKDDEVIMFIL